MLKALRTPVSSLRIALADRVVLAGLALVAAQLAFRAWALSQSWFYFDDLAFASRALNQPLDASYLTESYGGHLMPGAFALIWYLTKWSVYQWWPWAAVLLALQALASLGMFRLLLSMFGHRRAVLSLLTGYLVLVSSLPAFVWFAAGVNQLPLQVALVFGLHAHVQYLRTARLRHALATLVWTLAGLAFYEKTLLLFVVYAVVAIAYFTSGSTPERLGQLWRRYRAGLAAHTIVSVGYLAVYLHYGSNFDTQSASETPWLPVGFNLVLKAFATAAIGGPFDWRQLTVGSIADPSDFIMLVSWVALAGLITYAWMTRRRSGRAWWVIGSVLVADVALLVTGRAFLVGPDIALEYRYQSESSALLMLSIGLAYLPLLGAREQNDETPEADRSYETPRLVTAVTVVIALLAASSSLSFVREWGKQNPSPAFFDNVRQTLRAAPTHPVPMVDAGLPQALMWSYRYPENTYSHVLKPYSGQIDYVDSSVDSLYMFDDQGRLTPILVSQIRTALPGPDGACGYSVAAQGVKLPLSDRVIGGGWWVRIGYHGEGARHVRIVAGDDEHDLYLPAGLHSVFVSADGDFSSLRVEPVGNGAPLCLTDAALGLPQPVVPGP